MPDMVNDAIPLKPYLGGGAYTLQFFKLMITGRSQYCLDAEIDGKKWPNQEGEKHSIVTDVWCSL